MFLCQKWNFCQFSGSAVFHLFKRLFEGLELISGIKWGLHYLHHSPHSTNTHRLKVTLDKLGIWALHTEVSCWLNSAPAAVMWNLFPLRLEDKNLSAGLKLSRAQSAGWKQELAPAAQCFLTQGFWVFLPVSTKLRRSVNHLAGGGAGSDNKWRCWQRPRWGRRAGGGFSRLHTIDSPTTIWADCFITGLAATPLLLQLCMLKLFQQFLPSQETENSRQEIHPAPSSEPRLPDKKN